MNIKIYSFIYIYIYIIVLLLNKYIYIYINIVLNENIYIFSDIKFLLNDFIAPLRVSCAETRKAMCYRPRDEDNEDDEPLLHWERGERHAGNADRLVVHLLKSIF